MKKCGYVAILMILVLLLSAPVFAAAEQTTSLETGDRNVAFSNGYYGFCLDVNLKGAYAGDAFTPAGDTSAATSNKDNSNISQLLKILFTQCFADVFVSDGNGGYQIKDTNTLQAIVWHFSDGQYVWGEQARLVNLVKAYDGPAIPDDGYVRVLDNGDIITFSFLVMLPQNADQQAFFAYKLAVSQEAPHEHTWPSAWSTDNTSHWKECDCGEKKDPGSHSGGDADCSQPAICEVCQQPYGGKDSQDHTGGTEIRNARPATQAEPGYTGDTHCTGCGEKLSDGTEIPKLHTHDFGDKWLTDKDGHWQECACGEKKNQGNHAYQNRVCSVCGAVDPNKPVVDIPQTSDDFHPGLWSALLVLSMGGLLWMLSARKRYHNG